MAAATALERLSQQIREHLPDDPVKQKQVVVGSAAVGVLGTGFLLSRLVRRGKNVVEVENRSPKQVSSEKDDADVFVGSPVSKNVAIASALSAKVQEEVKQEEEANPGDMASSKQSEKVEYGTLTENDQESIAAEKDEEKEQHETGVIEEKEQSETRQTEVIEEEEDFDKEEAAAEASALAKQERADTSEQTERNLEPAPEEALEEEAEVESHDGEDHKEGDRSPSAGAAGIVAERNFGQMTDEELDQLEDELLTDVNALHDDMAPLKRELVEAVVVEIDVMLDSTSLEEEADRMEVEGHQLVAFSEILRQWKKIFLDGIYGSEARSQREEKERALDGLAKGLAYGEKELDAVQKEIEHRHCEMLEQEEVAAALQQALEELPSDEEASRKAIREEQLASRKKLKSQFQDELMKAQEEAQRRVNEEKERAKAEASWKKQLGQQHSKERMVVMKEALLALRRLEKQEAEEWELLLADAAGLLADEDKKARADKLKQKLESQRRAREQAEEEDRKKKDEMSRRKQAEAEAREEKKRHEEEDRKRRQEELAKRKQEKRTQSSPKESSPPVQRKKVDSKSPANKTRIQSGFGYGEGRDSHIVDVSRRFTEGGYNTPRSTFLVEPVSSTTGGGARRSASGRHSGGVDSNDGGTSGGEGGSPSPSKNQDSVSRGSGSYKPSRGGSASFRSNTGRDAHWRDHTGKPNVHGILANRK